MPNPALPPEKIEVIRLCLVAGRDSSGQRWTDKRIARALGVTDRTVRNYRTRVVEAARTMTRARSDREARMAEARQLIGIDD